jgi:predicted DNA-binding protein (MmcQ/YjbR family)
VIFGDKTFIFLNAEDIRKYCLLKRSATESLPFGPDTLVFKVGGKIFLLLGLDEEPLQFNAKCDPEKALSFRALYHAVLPGYHMNKKHWNTIICDGSVPAKLLRELIDHSYDLVFGSLPAAVRRAMIDK